MKSVTTNADSSRTGFANAAGGEFADGFANGEPASPARMVPALVAGQRVTVECPTWCAVDHVAFGEPYLEDVGHHGPSADLWMPKASGPVFLMSSQLALHPGDGRPAHVFVDEAEGHVLDADQADVYADGLEALAAAVRTQAQVLRATGGVQ